MASVTTLVRPAKSQERTRREWKVPTVDQVMVEERAAAFAKRSIKTSAKLEGLKMAVSMMDLTTLEGKDTPGKVAFLCRKAMQPLDPRYKVPVLRGSLRLLKSCPPGEEIPRRIRGQSRFGGDSFPYRPDAVETQARGSALGGTRRR